MRFPSSRGSLDYYYKYGNLMHSYRVECERRILENDTIESCERNFPHFLSFHQLLQEAEHPLHLNAGSSIQFVPSKEQKRLNTRIIGEREQDDTLQPEIADGCPEFSLPHDLSHSIHTSHSAGMSHSASASVSLAQSHILSRPLTNSNSNTNTNTLSNLSPNSHSRIHTQPLALPYEHKQPLKQNSASSKKRPVEDSIVETLKEISAKIDVALGPDSAFEKYFQLKAEIARVKLMRLKGQDLVASRSHSPAQADS